MMRSDWPTLWHKDQLAFPWGAAKRLRKLASACAAAISDAHRCARPKHSRCQDGPPGGVPGGTGPSEKPWP